MMRFAYIIFLLLTHNNFIGTRCEQDISPDKEVFDFIVPCDSNECLKDSIQAAIPGFIIGFPQYNMKCLDPLVTDYLSLLLPGDLSVIFRKGVTLGFKECIVDYAKLEDNMLEVSVHCNLSIKGKYKTSGQLLIFPIRGEGDSTIKCRNINFIFSLGMGSRVESDGKKYATILSFKPQHHYNGRVSYNITNLFKGNPEISQAVLEFMNENWKLIAEEFGTPIVNVGVTSIIKNIKEFLKVVPIEKMIQVRTESTVTQEN